MADQLEEQSLPNNEDALEAMIRRKFLEITGETLRKRASGEDDFVTVPDLREGGMSEGMVSLDFWEERGIPELRDRFRSLKMDSPNKRAVSSGSPVLPTGVVDNFVSFFSGTGLSEFGLSKLPTSYNWPMPSSLKGVFEGFVDEEDFEGLADGGYETNCMLKRLLNKRWLAAPEDRLKLAAWVISDWGGVRRNLDETLQNYVQMAEEDYPETPIKGVASYSKLLSVSNLHKYAIYDARVAVALNAAQYLMDGDRVFFPYIPGRNKITGDVSKNRGFSRQAAFSKEALQRQGWSVIAPRHAYQCYLRLLHHVQIKLPKQPPLYDLEMTLFSQAESLALQAMTRMSTAV